MFRLSGELFEEWGGGGGGGGEVIVERTNS